MKRFLPFVAASVLALAQAAYALQRDPAECAALAQPPPEAPGHAPATPGLRVGLALGSGSLHGLAHAGVIRELESHGLQVQVVSGTSAGALVGALWASGLKAREVERFLVANAAKDPSRFVFMGDGLFTNLGLREPLEEAFRGRRIEDWPRRFVAVATNVASGHRRLLMAGDGAAAVQASTAFPVVFAPVVLDGDRLVDGALVEPVPVDAARALGADFVIAVDVAYRPYEEQVSGVTGMGFQAMHILVNSLAAEQIKAADVAIRLDLHEFMACGPEAMIDVGARATHRIWPQIVERLSEAMRRRETP